jgi:outer membrane receptor for ferrienterochelin and colicins
LSIFAPVKILPITKLIVITAFLLLFAESDAQENPLNADTLASKQLEEVIVTATRNERTMGALPMPVSLIPKNQIKTMGSLRLNDVLAEQTGLVVVPQVNAQGNGIQLQGFNPDYTLILIDGEPIIGRYTGSLELSRIAVGNIKQIEIVKGPSSSLYGSDALAGVINIITERPLGTRANAMVRYGTNNTLDVNGDMSFTKKKLGVYLYGNRYHTDGYDLSPQNYGNTVSPFTNYTLNSKITYKISPVTDISLAGRYFNEDQVFRFEVESNGNRIRTSGNGNTQDWNFNPVLTHRFSDKLKAIARFYTTHYKTESYLDLETDGSRYYEDDFKQSFARPELNTEYFFNDKNILTLGVGYINEMVQTSRYGDEEKRFQETSYGFFQHEWLPDTKLSVIAGGRFDYNNIYGSQFSPKLSSQYELNKKVTFKLSGGVGFKAPDFRQLYFNFNNSAAGGYSVLGTEVAPSRIAELDAAGQIQTYLYDPSQLGSLQAERSISINAGANIELLPLLKMDLNMFHNSINNLIETQAVAITTSGQTIYSYRNILRAFTQGLEANLSYPVAKNLSLSAGYQLLYAKDKDVVEDVKAGEVYWRDPTTLVTKRLTPSEYFGLYNRSRHMANVKLFYNHKPSGWEGSLRVIYRGKYGIGDIRGNIQGETIPPSDVNSNSILDVYDNFVPGYALVNISVAKTIKNAFRIQAGVDNLFDYTEPVLIPNLPGRLLFTSISYSFSKKNVQP